MDGRWLDDTLAFMAVLESGSFTAGARRLGRDASIVSRRVSALEAELGTRLFERSTRRLAPTEAGSRFYERVKDATRDLEGARAEAKQAGDVPRGLLRLALPATFGRMWIAPLLPRFLAEFEAVSVEASYDDRYTDLIAERYDLAVRVGTLADSRLVARRLASVERIMCAAPSYLAAKGTPETPNDLRRFEALTNPRLGHQPGWRLHRGEERVTVRVPWRLSADDAESLVTAAVAGAGITIAATWLVARDIAEGRLVPVLPGWVADGGDTISLVTASSRFTPAKTRRFSDWILAAFRSPPWGNVSRSPS